MKRRVNWNPSLSVAGNAAAELHAHARRYFEAGRALENGTPGPEEFHGFRLETKRFRYVLEVFEPVYGEPLAERLKSLKQIQTHLGDMNDASTVKLLLEGRNLGRRTDLGAALDADYAANSKAFLEYWKNTFDAAGEEEAWVKMLAEPEALAAVRKPAVRVAAARAGRARQG